MSGGRGMLVLAAGLAGEELGAVEEALAVVGSLQGPSRGPVSQPGTRHRLSGAETGPALEREVPLWLDGSETAAAALAGKVAEGWVVSLDLVGVEGLASLNMVLDRAAVGASSCTSGREWRPCGANRATEK